MIPLISQEALGHMLQLASLLLCFVLGGTSRVRSCRGESSGLCNLGLCSRYELPSRCAHILRSVMCRAAALDAVCETNDIVDELVCHFIALSAQTKLVMLASVEYLICKLLPRSAQHQKGARILL